MRKSDWVVIIAVALALGLAAVESYDIVHNVPKSTKRDPRY